ncbi:hybrid sensor histidine kinase/response regulator [Prevotella stercorea]|uniref:hybrid sensor histidine kinase/response regulator n=1 Tax=Leyella stercorea TaxID=363265 RepID=UPI001C2C6C71|nr:hybrid sensor histidine kinase/response regulator [Leyella stercorea]MBU9897176.1 hybrid sensor histidine kinase/response regulator [Leyella stercorea]MBU9945397.1 hybrid sensor histidine kinase/response regulator [Leyella stercorea]
MFSTRIKILVGYALLAIVLLSATWMVYDNTRSLSAVNHASERFMARRDIVDSLVFSMLETANAERSVLLGDASKWERFDRALSGSKRQARKLRLLLNDTLKQQRLDTLMALLIAKRENTLLVMNVLKNNSRDIYYNNKVEALHSGRDSIVISPQTKERHEQHETVYEVVKTKRGFFRRLGDAFRKQRTDTISTTRLTHQPSTDTIHHRLNIADSVANALAEIHSEQQRANDRQQDIISTRNDRLQLVSIQLTKRTWQLLEDIQSDEHNALQRVVGKAISSRRAMIVRIAVLGLLAILSAAILVVYILRDIKRERRDRQRILEAKTETERIMQQRERLLLTITHDIKAPAASIAGFIDLLSEYVDRPKAVGYLQSISGSANHLLQLVSALLDYHKLESGKAERHEVSFQPTALVSECVAQMQPLAMAKQLRLATDINVAEDMFCRSDAFRIKQIVNNLVSNAIKYTDEGEVRVGITVMNGWMTLSVSDTGCGMTPEELQSVFNAFTRLPGAQGKEGVGLGLTITREIVTLLGGRINVASTKGKGTTFRVCLPVKVVTNQGVHSQSKHTQGVHLSQVHQQSRELHQQSKELHQQSKHNSMVGALETSAPPKGKSQHLNTSTSQPIISVVIVDDDRLQGQLLNEMLRRIDGVQFDITTTIHADEAIKIAVEKNPHIVFTDIEMPEMNGSEIMRRIRNASSATSATDKSVLRTKFVAMTAHEQSIMPQLRSDGFDACLFKPFSVHTLAATICQLTGAVVRVSEKEQNSKLTIAGEAEDNSKLKTQNSCSGKRLYEPSAKLKIALLPFTDGDPEAEAQIIGDIRKSIEEYLEMIGDGSDPERVAKAAHKAMPLLEMIEPGKNQWVAPLQTPGGALVSARLSPLARARSAPTKQQHPQSEEKNILVGALETSAPPEETTTPPNEQERERLTKQLIEKLKKILCDIY